MGWFAMEEVVQVIRQVGGACVPLVGCFFQTFQANGLQFWRNQRLQTPRRDWHLGQHMQDDIHHGQSQEWRTTRQHGVKDGTKRIHICLGSDVANLSTRLFRGHIGR